MAEASSHSPLVRSIRDHLGAMVGACGQRRVAFLLVVQVGAAAAEAIGLALLVPVIGVISGADLVDVPLVGSVAPWVALGLLAAAVVVRGALQWVSAVTANDVRVRTSDHLRLEALRAMFGARWEFVASRRRSHVVQSLTTEAMRTMAATDTLIQSSVSLLILLATSVVIVSVSPALGGAAVVGVLCVAALSRASVARSARLGVVVGEQIDAFGGAITDSLTAARVIRAHNARERWQRLATDEARRARAAIGAYVRTTTAVRVTMGVLSVVAAIGLVVLGRQLELDTARVIALGILAARLMTAAQTLVSESQYFANMAPALTKIADLTRAARDQPEDLRAAVSTSPAAGDPGDPGAVVELRGVEVRYPGAAAAALRGVDLRVDRDRLTVVTGPSGAGKSTLLDVVLGLLRPPSGLIVVDGAPVGDLAEWRARIGYVPPEPVLMPGTVRDNLVWSLQPGRSATDDELWSALEEGAVADVVRALPDGLSTALGETAELSGGERQRLSIARALAREPELLVLDEATSALDEETERLVLTRLLQARRTTIFVSHRPQVIAAADVVVRMHEGRVVTDPEGQSLQSWYS